MTLWQCPECNCTTEWTEKDLIERGTPVCSNCDEEMEKVGVVAEKGWVRLGEFGVDSGQVIITDPCYLKDWNANELVDKRVYVDKKTGKEYILRVNFENFENIIRDGKTMNQLIEGGEITEKVGNLSSDYSYEGACDTTLYSKLMGGNIGYSVDGVVASTGYGDGVYPVLAKYEDGRIKEIKIKFF